MIKYIQYFTFLVWNFESNINFVKTRIVVASKKKSEKEKHCDSKTLQAKGSE